MGEIGVFPGAGEKRSPFLGSQRTSSRVRKEGPLPPLTCHGGCGGEAPVAAKVKGQSSCNCPVSGHTALPRNKL